MSRTEAAPEAAVIIPHFNDVARLTRCLDALMPMLPKVGLGRVEVVVVDNDSTLPLDAARAAHSGLRIVTETRKGAAMAHNRGVAETTAPRLFFLDCDCVPAPDWLETALRVADRGDGGRLTSPIFGRFRDHTHYPGHKTLDRLAPSGDYAFRRQATWGTSAVMHVVPVTGVN